MGLGKPLSFNEVANDNDQNTIDNVVSSIKDIVTEFKPVEEVRSSGLGPELDNQPVSFILSIEPVSENVDVIQNLEDLEVEPRNPQAIFVMLPNIDPEDNNIKNESANKVIDGFVVDQDDAKAKNSRLPEIEQQQLQQHQQNDVDSGSGDVNQP